MRGEAALALQDDLPLLLLSAVAQPLAALLPYGCGTPLAGAALPVSWQCSLIPVYRQSPQCGERSNAAFGRQSAAVLPSLAPHDSKVRLQDVTICRRFMAKPCTPHQHCAACAVIQAPDCQCRGSRGKAPRPFSWGVRGIFSFREREYPPLPRPHTVWGQKQRCRAAPPLRPTGAKRNSPRGLLFSRARGAKVVQIVNMGYLSPFPLFFLWIICSIDFWRFRG